MATCNVKDIFQPTGLYAISSEPITPKLQWPDPANILHQAKKKLERLAWDWQLKTEWIPTRLKSNRDVMIILHDRSGKRKKKTYSKHFDSMDLLCSYKSPEAIARNILYSMHVDPIRKEPVNGR